jgi:pilus assembly protein CpaC
MTAAVATLCASGGAHRAGAQSVAVYGPETQGRADPVTRVDLSAGRALPITTPVALGKVSVAAPDIADIVVVGPRELVVNGKTAGETDAMLWLANGTRQHLRIVVRSPADRQQVAVYIRFAEVTKDLLRNIGVSARYRDGQGHARVGTGVFNTDNVFSSDGTITLPGTTGYFTVLTDFNTKRLIALLDAEEQNGRSRTLAEPNVLAGNRDTATFLAGGEIPIPVVQGGGGGTNNVNNVTILFKEFGIKLRFVPEVISDSLIKLSLQPEVSSLDYNNAITLSGFRIPAFRTRRVQTTVDVRRDQSLIISGLFDNEHNLVKTGIPFLQDIPILGNLFTSSRWQNSQTELLVIVTPVLVDPMRPRAQDTLPVPTDTTRPATRALKDHSPLDVKRPEDR